MTVTSVKILLVDDEIEILNTYRKLLSDLGHEVLTATSGQEAFVIIKENADHLACVISDYSMPDDNGMELRKQMLQDYKDVPFILISGHITRETAMKAVEFKINAFLEKPFDLKKLTDLIVKESTERINNIREEDELRTGFVTEAQGLIEEMETLIMGLEENSKDYESMNRIFACAHTIKGTSGFFKPDTVHKFTHRYEDFLSKLKSNPDAINPAAISILLKGLDIIKGLVQELSSGLKTAHDLEKLVEIFSPKLTNTNQPVTVEKNKSASNELKVSVKFLNDFMEKSGELTVLRNMVNKAVRVIEGHYPEDQNVLTLVELLEEIHKVNDFMQEQVTDLRKIPLKQIFKPLIRTARDLSVALKKKIVFKTSGDEIRIDHSLAEVLNKCLIHLLRNAADHGIECAETRKQFNKKEEGSIDLQAHIVGEEVIVRMKDDGKGIDPQKIKEKALEKGVITIDQAQKMSDPELQLLIFEPGFSTAEQVSDVSGRGVGTDMVKGAVQGIGGQIQIESIPQQGCEFILRLPIPRSVLIISSLLIKCDGQIFAIPQENILRVVEIGPQNRDTKLRFLGDDLFLNEKEELTPIFDLRRILSKNIPNNTEASFLLVWLQSKDKEFCLKIDAIHEIEDIVVKRVEKWLDPAKIYAGATFLGDGSVGMILDIEGIAQFIGLKAIENQLKKEIRKKINNEAHVPSALVLLFGLGKSLYGLFQTEVFRLEEFSTDQLRPIGSQVFVIYRQQSMPIFTFDRRLMKLQHMSYSPASVEQKIPVIIMASENEKYFGVAVDYVQDFVPIENASNDFETNQTCIIKGQTVTVLKFNNRMAS